MALFRRFFYRKPPDRLLEISERVYFFDCCFSTDVLEEDEYRDIWGELWLSYRITFQMLLSWCSTSKKGIDAAKSRHIFSI
ncbi:formin-like protein 20 [Sesbania bispinosa]|nr:formin-like protein 20 [Sesbania bispinosa]